MNEKARLTGTIVHGKGLGHTVGMPTANLRCDEGSALPEAGVYASRLEVDGQTYFGVTNVGTRPSVDSDVSASLYRRPVQPPRMPATGGVSAPGAPDGIAGRGARAGAGGRSQGGAVSV